MEYQCLHFRLHLILGIMSSLLAGISYSSKLGSHKYITEAYFQKYDTLHDRVFQDFISNEVSQGFCEEQNFMPKLSVWQRQLNGDGSHRRLISSLKIENQPEVSSKLASCKAIIVERLPSGVFADPFELEHLTQRGVFTDASAFGDTDLELPTVRANRSVVEIHMDLGPSTLSENNNAWELNIELPLHARYAPLGKHGYTKVEFGSPDLFVRCIVEGDSHNQSCIYSSPNHGARSSSAAIVWEVPSGIVKYTKIVSVLTFISAVVGALSILAACVFHSEISIHSDSKPS